MNTPAPTHPLNIYEIWKIKFPGLVGSPLGIAYAMILIRSQSIHTVRLEVEALSSELQLLERDVVRLQDFWVEHVFEDSKRGVLLIEALKDQQLEQPTYFDALLTKSLLTPSPEYRKYPQVTFDRKIINAKMNLSRDRFLNVELLVGPEQFVVTFSTEGYTMWRELVELLIAMSEKEPGLVNYQVETVFLSLPLNGFKKFLTEGGSPAGTFPHLEMHGEFFTKLKAELKKYGLSVDNFVLKV